MRVATCPPGITNAGIEAVFGTYEAVLRGGVDYWTQALNRGAGPLDVMTDVLTWWGVALRRSAPQWASKHVIAQKWPIARLRDFSEPRAKEMVATLLLPPQAGHDSCIVDFAVGQSQIATAQAAGLERLYALDWVGATNETKHASVEDYLDVISDVVARVGGRVNLVGDCQGGWLAVIYAALHPEAVNTLTIAGAPVDFHAGEPLIGDWLQLLTAQHDLALYRGLVAANDGVLPGEVLLGGFMAMQPAGELDRQLQLLAHINESDHVTRYQKFETWFQHTQPIPGSFYLWIVEHLFQKNELIAGTLSVCGNVVDLAKIDCPLYLIAGGKDHITPPAQVYALAAYATTRPENVHRRETTGGHLGLFMGHEALREHWRPVFGEIANQSVS